MKCPHCGVKLGSGDYHICPVCAQDIARSPENRDERCPACGAKMSPTARVCPICGASVPGLRLAFTSNLFSGVAGIVTALALLGALWVLKPWAQAIPTPTPTMAPSATPTRIVTKTLTPTSTPTITPTPTPAFFRHTVISGDTIAFIAEQYGVTIAALIAANDIGDGEHLSIDQVLIIPLSSDLVPVATIPTPGGPTPTPLPPIHIVVEGENLRIIANLYGITVEDIVKANNLINPELIRIGQEIVIPGVVLTPTPANSPVATRPPPTREPDWKYRAPVLLSPVNGETFRGQDTEILLNWASVGILGTDEWYVLRIRTEASESNHTEGSSRSEWTKNTSWRVPDWMHPVSKDDPHTFKWDITVVKRPSQGAPEALSPRSASRRFSWY